MARRKARKHVSSRKQNIYVIIIGLLAVAAAYAALLPRTPYSFEAQIIPTSPQSPDIRNIYHVHADFLVMVNGKEIDFNRTEFDYVNPAIHMHIANFQGHRVIHIESRSAGMSDFFSSLDMSFTGTCFAADDEQYCNNDEKKLKLYVNGVQNEEFERYRPQDMDRILLTYGAESDDEIGKQISAVTSFACIFSGKCEPPAEAEDSIFYN